MPRLLFVLVVFCWFSLGASRQAAHSLSIGDTKVMFLGFPHFSHLTFLLPIARELHSRGHEVLFPLPEKYADTAERMGVPWERFRGDDVDGDRWKASLASVIGALRGTDRFELSVFERLMSQCPDTLSSIAFSSGPFALLRPLWNTTFLPQLKSLFSSKTDDSFAIVFDFVWSPMIWESIDAGEFTHDEFRQHAIMLVPSIVSMIRMNPFTFPLPVSSTLLTEFSLLDGFDQIASVIKFLLSCPSMRANAKKMRFLDTLTVVPGMVGLDYLVDESDWSPLRRYVGMIGLSDEERAQVMSEEMEVWLNDHENVLYVSSGSGTTFPRKFLSSLFRVICELNQKQQQKNKNTIISVLFRWIVNENDSDDSFFDCMDKNHLLVTTSWIAQSEVLKHPNTRAFVSHGGSGGMAESIRTATPVLIAPIFAPDQFLLSARFEERQLGLQIASDEDLRPEVLGSKILDVMFEKNQLFAKNLKRMNTLSRLQGEERAVADLVEEMLLFGGIDHLEVFEVSGLGGIRMAWNVVLIVAVVTVMSWLCCRFCCCCYCCRRKHTDEMDEQKKNL